MQGRCTEDVVSHRGVKGSILNDEATAEQVSQLWDTSAALKNAIASQSRLQKFPLRHGQPLSVYSVSLSGYVLRIGKDEG